MSEHAARVAVATYSLKLPVQVNLYSAVYSELVNLLNIIHFRENQSYSNLNSSYKMLTVRQITDTDSQAFRGCHMMISYSQTDDALI